MFKTLLDFLLYNGIGQNITAGILVGVPMRVWAEVRVLRPMREHRDLVRAIHAHVAAPGPLPSSSPTERP